MPGHEPVIGKDGIDQPAGCPVRGQSASGHRRKYSPLLTSALRPRRDWDPGGRHHGERANPAGRSCISMGRNMCGWQDLAGLTTELR